MNRDIPLEAKQAAVEKILSSVAFARAEQLRRLLGWLGERALENGAVPTEQEVAREALGRPDSFDPQADSLVRKEMSRLRAKLRQYYSSDGTADPVRVQNNDGYRLSFEFLRPTPSGTVHVGTSLPCLMLLPLRSLPADRELAEEFGEELMFAIASSGHFDLVAPEAAQRLQLGPAAVDFLVNGSIRRRGDSIQLTLWLADARTGRAKRFYRLAEPEPEALASRVVALLCRDLLKHPVAIDSKVVTACF